MTGERINATAGAEKGQAASPLGELIERFLLRRSLGAAAKQLRALRATVEAFCWRRQVMAPGQITGEAVAAYLRDRRADGRSAKTVANDRARLSLFCDYLVAEGLLEYNPVAAIPAPRVHRAVPVWLTDAEVGEALDLAEASGGYCEVAVAINTGLRLNELRHLQWGHVDLARRALTVVRPKGERERVVPLTASAIAALERQRRYLDETDGAGLRYVFPARHTFTGGWRWRDRPRCTQSWLRMLRPLRARMPAFRRRAPGSVGNGWHLFRHTFASRLVQRGVSAFKVAQWMGHRDTAMISQVYGHLAPGYDADIDAADAGGGRSGE